MKLLLSTFLFSSPISNVLGEDVAITKMLKQVEKASSIPSLLKGPVTNFCQSPAMANDSLKYPPTTLINTH